MAKTTDPEPADQTSTPPTNPGPIETATNTPMPPQPGDPYQLDDGTTGTIATVYANGLLVITPDGTGHRI